MQVKQKQPENKKPMSDKPQHLQETKGKKETNHCGQDTESKH
jgi:hypothetical protein